MNKTALYLIYFCIYSAALLLIGKSSLREDPTARSYFLCDRTASLPLCICTFVGTWLSAITILSLTGGVYEDGLAVLAYSVFPWFFGAFLLAAVSRRLYAHNVVTIPELFGQCYQSPALQVVYGAIMVVVYVCYLVTQYKGFGTVAAALFDIPYPVAVLMVYLFVLYTTFGGYRSVLRTDAFNLVLLVLSLVVLLGLMIGWVGGFPELYVQAGALTGSDPSKDLLSLFNNRYTPLICMSMFWGWGLGLAANPQYMVRVLSARNPRSARWTVLGSLILLAFLYFALVHIGLAARVLVPQSPEVASSDEIIVHLMNNELYSVWSGFFLFSVIGACVSTANSQLLLIASSFSYDIVRTVSPKEVSERQVLNLGRLAVFGVMSALLVLYIVLLCVGGKGARFGRETASLAALAAFCTVWFTLLDDVLTPLWYGYTLDAAIAYFYTGFLAMLPQTVCAAVSVVVLFPVLKRIFGRAGKRPPSNIGRTDKDMV